MSAISEPSDAPGPAPLPPVTSSGAASASSAPSPGLAPVTRLAATPSAAAASTGALSLPVTSATPAAASPASMPPSTMVVPSAGQGQASNSQDADGFSPNDDTLNYQRYQNPELYDPQLHSLQEFINEQDNSSPIGIQVREDQRKLESGQEATGLLIIGVASGSPAAKAGLHAHTDTARTVLEGAAVAGSMVFPPAVLLIPILANVPVGESYDLIIAVDGWRVMNFVEFEERMRDVQPGEIVYLTVIRNGKRMQVQVLVPQDQAAVAPGF